MEPTAHVQILLMTAALGVFFASMIWTLVASNFTLSTRRAFDRKRADLS